MEILFWTLFFNQGALLGSLAETVRTRSRKAQCIASMLIVVSIVLTIGTIVIAPTMGVRMVSMTVIVIFQALANVEMRRWD